MSKWNEALVISYGLPVIGREAAAVENFGNVLSYLGGLAAEGICSEPEVLHHFHGEGGMIIVKTETQDALDRIMGAAEFQKLRWVGNLTSTDFRYDQFTTGDEMTADMGGWLAAATELGYA